MEEVKNTQRENRLLSKQRKAWMIILVCLVCISPLFLNPIDDAGAHIARLQGLVDNINQMGILGAARNWKIYFSMMHGAGYGYPMFYGDILLWPFALILTGLKRAEWLGQNDEAVYFMYKIVLQISLVMTFLQAYICQRKALKNNLIKVTKTGNTEKISRNDLNFLIAYFYLMTPYIVMVLHNQQYRVAAYGIVPWAIYNLVQILYKSNDDRQEKAERAGISRQTWLNILGLAVQMWLLLETHLITTLYTGIVLLIIYVRYLITNKNTIKEKAIKTILVCIAATICLLLSFRFLSEMLNQLSSGYLVISNTTNDLGQKYNTQILGTLIPEWMVVAFGQITGLYNTDKIHFGSVGYVGFYYIGLVILGLVEHRTEKTNRIKTLQVVQIAYGLLYFVLMGTQILSGVLEFTQFRYRLNTILDIGLIIIGVQWITSSIDIRDINKIIKYVLIIQTITVFGNIAYASMLNIGHGDLSIQVGGGAEYLSYNNKYDIFEQTKDDYPLHYNVVGQVTDMLKYKEDFEKSLETIGYEHESIIDENGMKYWFDVDKTTLRWLENNDKQLVIPITYYKDIYRTTIETVGQNNDIELKMSKSDLGYCQIDDNEIQSIINKDLDGLRYRITLEYIN